ncbi:MAG: hypothetical protein Q8N31_14045 [Reyranella sp.]|nr:hypothetical protein [Reyranella sp.]MDP3161137.1 hypothetical protein [Reyranella sp.]
MRWPAILLAFGGFSGGLAATSVGQDLAHAQEPAKTKPVTTKMVFMTDHGAGIVLSVSRCEGFVILEGPADQVALVRDGLVQSGLPPSTIIARPVDARGL